MIHQLSLWNKRGVGTITTGDLRLDEYEYDMIESFFWYHRAVKAAREIEEDTDMGSDMTSCDSSSDSVPEAMLYLQFQTMEREDVYVH